MTLRIGLIGAGAMGSSHARTIQAKVSDARIVALAEADGTRRAQLSEALGIDDRPLDGLGLIGDPGVDAVIIASPDDTHAALTLACIAAGKPVLCEKPLGPTSEACRAVVEAEMAGGRRLVQVGYMRRFDPGYLGLRRAVAEGSLGDPLFLHCIHRNRVAPPWMTSDMILTNSVVHELDVARFVLGGDFIAASVISPRASREAPTRRPQLVVLETSEGVVVDVEAFVDAQYGYEVRGELVCERGTVSLSPHPATSTRHGGHDGIAVDEDWTGRFEDAYREMLCAFVRAALDGTTTGADAFDGYKATRTAERCLDALRTAQRVAFEPEPPPAFYAR